MAKSRTTDQRLAEIQKEFAAFYPDQPLTGEVSAKTQSEFLLGLKPCIPLQQFYFVVDMPNFEVRDINGVDIWLGYLKSEFSMKTYIDALHEGLIEHQIDHAKISTAKYARGEERLEFGKPLFWVFQAFKHAESSKYLLVKRLVLPFQFSGNRLMSYLSYFTILGEYKNEPPQFQYPDNQAQIALGITEKVKENFLANLDLSLGAMRVLKMLIKNPSLTAQEVAGNWEWKKKPSKRAVEKYCREILEWGKKRFPIADFNTAKDVARHIAKEYGRF